MRRDADGAGRPLVGAVVCTHLDARLEQMVEAVDSLERQTRRPDRVVVVVDGDDTLAARVRARLAGCRAEVVGLGRNLGVGAARTRGVQEVPTELVAFLDDDAVAEPDWLETLLAPMVRPEVMGVGGRSLPRFEGRRSRWLPDEYLWTVGCSYAGMSEERQPTRNLYGGCSVVRRDVFLGVGGFDASLGHRAGRVGGGEEADFSLRAIAAHPGHHFLSEPRARIWHRVPAERTGLGYLARRCWIEGRSKAALRHEQPEALGPEREFARTLPAAVVRELRRGRVGRAVGIVVGTLAVLAGMGAGSLATRDRGRR